MEIKYGKEAEETINKIGAIHITAGEKGAAIEGNAKDIIKAFIYICESMAIVKIPEEMLIEIVKETQKKIKDKQKVCPRCENIEIGAQDNFCKICGYKF